MMIQELLTLIDTLREQCPWDRQQTVVSLKNKVIEEAYELLEAIESDDEDAIKEEIGDLIFLCFFYVRMLKDEHHVGLEDILTEVVRKYKTKHPHVFGDKQFRTQDEVLTFWHRSKEDIFRGIALSLPALMAAQIIQERARNLCFDWSSVQGPLEKVNEEVRELQQSTDRDDIVEEFGDLLFACVNLGRHLKVEPEEALRQANKKFVRRFRSLLEELQKQDKDIAELSLEEMDRIWDAIKERDG
jgi:tetrapyrrole methylase family protein/MazG family protein